MKLIHSFSTALLGAALLMAGCSSDTSTTSSTSSTAKSDAVSNESEVTIGILQYVEHPALDAATEGFEDYLKDNGYADAKIDFKSAQGEIANCTSIAQKFVNDDVSLIFAVATPAAQAAANETKDIPIVLSAVTDPADSGLVKSNEEPGGNVTGSSDLTPVEAQFDLLQEILPDVKTIGLLYCNAEANSVFQINLAKEQCEERGLEYKEASVTDSNQIQQVVESLNGKVDAIYVPTDNMMAESMATVTQAASQYGIPCIVGEEGMVENGGLATYGINYYELGQLAGAQAVAILKDGDKPAEMAIAYLPADQCTLTINKKTAETLNLDIPQSVLDRATVVGEE
ncbi:MAG: ABC transporter substrate-binding protein [Allobaculum sp.]|nr:ABC transporter substrate-binding protein [Allobaculum sp.]